MSACEKIKTHCLKHNMEYQYWLYATGNVSAAVAGAGGFEIVKSELASVFSDASLHFGQKILTLAADYPDAAVAIGLAGVTLVAPIARRAAKKWGDVTALNSVDTGATLSATIILGYCVSQDTSFITTSAASLVLGPSFLRHSANNPFFKKLGGTFIAIGGALLTAFGVESGLHHYSDAEYTKLALDGFTALSGSAVSLAGLFNYEGGIAASKTYQNSSATQENKPPIGWVEKLEHPTKGLLSNAFKKAADKPVRKVNRFVKDKFLRHVIPKDILDHKHFKTSMLIRLPPKVAAFIFAAITQNDTLAFAFGTTAGGDVMVGLEDDKRALHAEPEPVTT